MENIEENGLKTGVASRLNNFKLNKTCGKYE
jgi:hypothetical protein